MKKQRIYNKICDECSKEFKSKRKHALYCSKECKHKAGYRRVKEKKRIEKEGPYEKINPYYLRRGDILKPYFKKSN